jgi:hypothetical protein
MTPAAATGQWAMIKKAFSSIQPLNTAPRRTSARAARLGFIP